MPIHSTPTVWLLLGDKLGDNAQVETIAEAMRWPVETKRLAFLEKYRTGKPPFRADLYHLDREQSASLLPPWPDLIITIGRRPSMVACWIQDQSRGKTKIVLVGRPKRDVERFDLVIAPPQFDLPDRSNVMSLSLPLMRVDETAIAAAANSWRERLADRPRPITAVLVGGPTKPYRLDRGVALDIVAGAERILARDGGSLYVSTSRRTPPEVSRTLRERLPAGSAIFVWGEDGDNPYRALLGLADQFVVTGDSISMMVEVARLGRPLAIYSLPTQPTLGDRFKAMAAKRLHNRNGALVARMTDRLLSKGYLGFARDLGGVHRSLIKAGLAVPFGDPFLPVNCQAPDELAAVVERVEGLFAKPH
ncbi:mitochondrial fission ELM1 family protein [Marinivivus vitaminiproducens]|uniref:mitochondrial fission ELM1 family protein n=1 Tax=Marinivivus vitaminiproducens TaxID=3035935 RepID=UPI00279987AC|nr:ELM1/GtrOC1 family putative glycosyltransferase [Geminicoccaceae bacterium SCSIO 64248]